MQVLAAIKEELEQEGVNIRSLEQAARASGSAARDSKLARSDTVLVLKNLPYSAAEDEIADLFQKYHGCSRLILPATRALAIVEMPDKHVSALDVASNLYILYLAQ
jgi:multiple RNA-binding domain-containing protein 1